jgi:hypothetical protein
MISGSRLQTPQPLVERSLIVTKDGKAWQRAVKAKQGKLPLVVLLDAMGQVLWTYAGVADDEAYREPKTSLDAASR